VPGVLSLVRRASGARPYLAVLRLPQPDPGVQVRLLPGEPEATRRLGQILGTTAGPVPERGLLVHAAVASHDPTAPAAALAAHRRAGGRVLAILVGTPEERARLERVVLAQEGLGAAHVSHVASLDGAGAREVARAVAEALGDDLPAVARTLPSLREAATDLLVGRAARRAAAIAAVGVVPGAARPVLTLLQARLVADLAAVYGRRPGIERALDLAAVVAAGFGLRGLGRSALLLLPGPAFALRAGVAYAGTRAIGAAAARWLAEGGEPADRPLGELRERMAGALRGITGRERS
jgi:uncharacterized protein (DUF697 family)